MSIVCVCVCVCTMLWYCVALYCMILSYAIDHIHGTVISSKRLMQQVVKLRCSWMETIGTYISALCSHCFLHMTSNGIPFSYQDLYSSLTHISTPLCLSHYIYVLQGLYIWLCSTGSESICKWSSDRVTHMVTPTSTYTDCYTGCWWNE